MDFSHTTVLLEETVAALNINPDGIYVDCTCGGAGHSKLILSFLSEKGRLIAIDQDPDAIKVIKERIGSDKRVTVVHNNFSNLKEILSGLGIEKVDGIIADLGISSHQVDTAERGFSFKQDAPLDMRMSQQGMTASEMINTYSQKELTRVFRDYAEEKFAPRIAAAIIREREKSEITGTVQLAEIVKSAIPAAARRTKNPCGKIFMAIRIEINREMVILEQAIRDMFDSLAENGRIAIISFHSIEDRIVKKTFASFCEGCICPPSCPVCICGRTPAGMLPFKKIVPGENELENNNRSRSATLRCVKKIN